MAIAAVIVLHGRAEKSNFIDIQGEKKDGGVGGEKKNLLWKKWNWGVKQKKKKKKKKKKHQPKKRREIERERGGGGGEGGWKETWQKKKKTGGGRNMGELIVKYEIVLQQGRYWVKM